MISSKSRVEFESFLKTIGDNSTSDGNYYDKSTQKAWLSWQASESRKVSNEPIAEAIKYAAMAGDLILIGALCRLLTEPRIDTFNKLSSMLHGISDTLAVQELYDWVLWNQRG